jgi:hypothetical protein
MQDAVEARDAAGGAATPRPMRLAPWKRKRATAAGTPRSRLERAMRTRFDAV